MTAKCSVFIATSLDGFIARLNGSIDWLMKANTLVPAGEDGGYKSFISTVDVLVMGRHTYEAVLSFDVWPYGDLPIVVLSTKKIDIPEHLQRHVSASNEVPTTLVKRLSKQGAKHLYIDGGITIQRFLDYALINELTITIVPVLLGYGRSLFGELKDDIELNHVETRTISGGFVQVKYYIDTSRGIN